MSTLRERFVEDLGLRGHAEKTIEAYVFAVHDLARYTKRSPDTLSEEEVRGYFIYLSRERKLSDSSIRQRLYGIRLFFELTVKRPMQVLSHVLVRRRHVLPVVLSRKEVQLLLRAVRQPVSRMCLITIYSCGLRISEGLSLETRHIDGDRKMLRVEQGKGKKDRYVPLPERTLELLRFYWQNAHSHATQWLFPGLRGCALSSSTLQRTIRLVAAEVGITKAVKVHTLRHCYATHLLEAGVDIRAIQSLLGHAHVDTTMIYTHVTDPRQQDVRGLIDLVMSDL
jgi:site-specific recombinase XerD